jgi:hypothetical protein
VLVRTRLATIFAPVACLRERGSKPGLLRFVRRSGGCGDEVSDLRFRCGAELTDGILNDSVVCVSKTLFELMT